MGRGSEFFLKKSVNVECSEERDSNLKKHFPVGGYGYFLVQHNLCKQENN